MILKKRKKIVSIVSFILAVIFGLAFICLLLPRKNVGSASASGFEDVGTVFDTYTVSFEFVLDDSTTETYVFSSSDEGAWKVQNGISIVQLFRNSTTFITSNISRIVDIYVAVTFPFGFDINNFDFFFSDEGALSYALNPIQLYDMNGALTTSSYEYFVPPMFVGQINRIVYPTNVELIKSFVFVLNPSYFQLMQSAFLQLYTDYFFFIYPKNQFVDFSTAYNQGYNAGQDFGYSQGYNAGNAYGYQAGVLDGRSQDNTFFTLISAVIDVPVQTFFGLLNFEILGFNIANFILSILTIGLIVYIIRLVL